MSANIFLYVLSKKTLSYQHKIPKTKRQICLVKLIHLQTDITIVHALSNRLFLPL